MNIFHWLKRTVSIGTIIGVAGYFITSAMRVEATSAFVTAPKVTVGAPVSGIVSHSLAVGQVHGSGEALLAIRGTPETSEEVRYRRLELTSIEAELASLSANTKKSSGELREAQAKVSRIEGSRRLQLNAALEEAKSNLEVAEAELEAARATLGTAQPLCDEQLKARAECVKLATTVTVREREMQLATDKLESVRVAVRAMRQGDDSGPQGSSQLVHQQRLKHDIGQRLDELEIGLRAKRARAEALRSMSELTFPVIAPSRLRVWNVTQDDGLPVGAREEVASFANCERLFVLAYLTKSKYGKLKIGSAATVTVASKKLRGEVIQLLGLGKGLRAVPEMPTVAADASSGPQLAVAISVDGLAGMLGQTCDVGRAVEVDFPQ